MCFLPTYLVILFLGVGSTKPNERENEEDKEPEELEDDAWMKLLDNDDEVLSLKSWKEVSAIKANKTNIALALRAYMRQAWSEWIIFHYHFPI